MAWTVASYIDRGTAEVLQNPLFSACGVALMGSFAGGELVYHFTSSWPSHGFISAAGDYLMVAVFLGIALERAYFLSRAIRRLQNSAAKSPVP